MFVYNGGNVMSLDELRLDISKQGKKGIYFNCHVVYPTVPDKMVMVLAVIFGAHLLPYGWLYKSKAYSVMSVLISFSILIIGINFNEVVVSIVMIIYFLYG